MAVPALLLLQRRQERELCGPGPGTTPSAEAAVGSGPKSQSDIP